MTISAPILSRCGLFIVQVVVFAYFMGELSGKVERNQSDILDLKKAASAVKEEVDAAVRSDDRMGFRIEGLEKLEAKVEAVRDEVVASRASAENDRGAMKRQNEKMEREIGGIHRQLANIASGRTGLLEITKSAD